MAVWASNLDQIKSKFEFGWMDNVHARSHFPPELACLPRLCDFIFAGSKNFFARIRGFFQVFQGVNRRFKNSNAWQQQPHHHWWVLLLY